MSYHTFMLLGKVTADTMFGVAGYEMFKHSMETAGMLMILCGVLKITQYAVRLAYHHSQRVT